MIPDSQLHLKERNLQPIVRLNRDTGEREIVLMRWGLVPYWAMDEEIGLRTINAKAETITTTPACREAIKYRRCHAYGCIRKSPFNKRAEVIPPRAA